MAEITQDGAFVIQEPRRNGNVAEIFSTIDAVYERLALKCSKLGECHPTSTGVNKEYAKLIILMFKKGIPIPDDLEPPPLPVSDINLVEEFGINPVSLSSDDGSRLQAILGPNVRLFDESNGIYLRDDVRSAAKRHVSRYYSDDNYRACVDEEHAAVAGVFNAAAIPADRSVAPVESLPSSCNDGPALPREAPKLWANRTEDDPPNPSAFIREIWKKWLPHVLARQDLKSYDPPLYTAYAQWIRPDRHPNDTVDFAPKRSPANKLDDNEFVARKRKANADAQARRRAALRSSGLRQP